LENSWSLKNSDDVRKLGAVIGEPTAPAKHIRDTAIAALGARLAGATTTTDASGVASGDMLSRLVSGGFATFEGIGQHKGEPFSLAAFPGAAARMVVVNATDASTDQQMLVPSLVHALADGKVPTLLANVYHEQRGRPGRGAGVSAVRDDSTLSKQVATVDDLDLTEGQVAAVLALADLGRRVGHYGYGDGATSVVPAVTQP
jgi:hypothetical protein